MDFAEIYEQWENSRKGGNEPFRRPEEDSCAAEELHPTQRKGLARSRLRKMEPEETLDLHGMTVDAAEESLEKFLRSALKRGRRKVLIIHGKGIHSTGGAVLPARIRKYVAQSTLTGEYGEADRRHGGSGAIWVILRQRSL